MTPSKREFPNTGIIAPDKDNKAATVETVWDMARYVAAFEEWVKEEELGMRFSHVFHATGTGSTQAGLVCGRELERQEQGERSGNRIVGISIARPCPRGRDVVKESILDYYRMRRQQNPGQKLPEFCEEDLVFEDGYRLGGYGKSSPEEEACIRRVMRQDGIPMDTTYVGKAFFGEDPVCAYRRNAAVL